MKGHAWLGNPLLPVTKGVVCYRPVAKVMAAIGSSRYHARRAANLYRCVPTTDNKKIAHNRTARVMTIRTVAPIQSQSDSRS